MLSVDENNNNIPIPIAERVWAVPKEKPQISKTKQMEGFRSIPFGKRVLVFDTETTVDKYQELKFGCFRLYHNNKLNQEGLFIGDVLSTEEIEIIKKYALDNNLPVFTVKEFINRIFFKEVYNLGTLCVGFNLPFDLSRLAIRWAEGRNHWKDAFVLILSENKNLPRVRIKSLNSKSSFIEFAKPFKYENNMTHIKGNFLDLRTFGWALTNRSLSLSGACNLFDVEHGKSEVEEHGVITPKYIDYNRRDVLASWELYLKMIEEFKKHPIDLLPTKAFSPASIGKAYLKSMGIESLATKQPDFPNEVLGHAMASYYGGRAEVKSRKISVPVTYLDVLSMYPSVFILQNLWQIVIAERIETHECTQDIQRLIEELTLEDLFDKETWPKIPALVEILPDGDVLPVRAQYEQGGDFQIGINYLTSSKSSWYTLSDVIASKLLTGKAPKILRAYRIVPVGIQEGLNPIMLGREVFVDPEKDDFFKLLIEKRKEIQQEALKCDNPIKKKQLESLQLFLKILANSTSYGIFAEFNRSDVKDTDVEVYSSETFSTSTNSLEVPGPFANPLIATVITGAARLILAMIEVTALKEGTNYAFCDTDSMAIIGEDPFIAKMIVKKFGALCPYKFGGSLLKIEDENFSLDPSKERATLYCYGISAKRYVLYNLKDRKPIIRKYSEHGLGHIMSPESKTGSHWIYEIWEFILAKHLGISSAEPAWLDCPALGRMSITRPRFIKSLEKNNSSKKIRPFNFMLVAFPDGQSSPCFPCKRTGIVQVSCPTPRINCAFRKDCILTINVRPVAPYERMSSKWFSLPWVDLNIGQVLRLDFGIRASGVAGRLHVKTYRDNLMEYEHHREVKAAGPEGKQCGKQTTGQLQRLRVEAVRKVFIGKESNRLDEAEILGLDQSTYTVYEKEWYEIRGELKRFSAAELARETGISIRGIKRLRNGKVKPHPKNEAAIRAAVHKLAILDKVEDMR